VGIDPAIASGPFVTITVDISASFIFLLFVLLMLSGQASAAS
jgi:Mg/Co/Ni transporter MgtE